MNRFAFLTVAALACGLTACSHYPENYDGYVYGQPKTITTSSSTSSVQNQCVDNDGIQLSEADCNARARELNQSAPAAAVVPGAAVVQTGKTCTTTNGVTSCVKH